MYGRAADVLLRRNLILSLFNCSIKYFNSKVGFEVCYEKQYCGNDYIVNGNAGYPEKPFLKSFKKGEVRLPLVNKINNLIIQKGITSLDLSISKPTQLILRLYYTEYWIYLFPTVPRSILEALTEVTLAFPNTKIEHCVTLIPLIAVYRHRCSQNIDNGFGCLALRFPWSYCRLSETRAGSVFPRSISSKLPSRGVDAYSDQMYG